MDMQWNTVVHTWLIYLYGLDNISPLGLLTPTLTPYTSLSSYLTLLRSASMNESARESEWAKKKKKEHERDGEKGEMASLILDSTRNSPSFATVSINKLCSLSQPPSTHAITVWWTKKRGGRGGGWRDGEGMRGCCLATLSWLGRSCD